jgi:hypothetical protein
MLLNNTYVHTNDDQVWIRTEQSEWRGREMVKQKASVSTDWNDLSIGLATFEKGIYCHVGANDEVRMTKTMISEREREGERESCYNKKCAFQSGETAWPWV